MQIYIEKQMTSDKFLFLFADKSSCAYNNGGCDVNANCTQSASGVKTCTCHESFAGDGYNCSTPCDIANGGCHENATCSYSVFTC